MPALTVRARSKKTDAGVVEDPFVAAELRALDATQGKTEACTQNPISFTARTLEVWQPRSTRRLSPEDVRQVIENATGFFHLLNEWARADNGKS